MTEKIADNIIAIKSICHTYPDGDTGIRDLSLSINKGEFIILAGKNGSGKTTFLRHLNGLLLPDSGQIMVNGKEVSKNLVQTRQTIGMVFQDADTQIVGDTVFDEVAFGLENLKFKRSDINNKVCLVLKDLNLYPLKDRSPSSLSGGEKRKLAIAGILVMGPEVIVFDEPFSNLDYPGTNQILSLIIELNCSGHTIIVATHDLEPVIFNATRMIIMEDGYVRKDDKPQNCVKHLEEYGIKEPGVTKFAPEPVEWHN
jgi:biotin transport system ATP-binding protein